MPARGDIQTTHTTSATLTAKGKRCRASDNRRGLALRHSGRRLNFPSSERSTRVALDRLHSSSSECSAAATRLINQSSTLSLQPKRTGLPPLPPSDHEHNDSRRSAARSAAHPTRSPVSAPPHRQLTQLPCSQSLLRRLIQQNHWPSSMSRRMHRLLTPLHPSTTGISDSDDPVAACCCCPSANFCHGRQ